MCHGHGDDRTDEHLLFKRDMKIRKAKLEAEKRRRKDEDEGFPWFARLHLMLAFALACSDNRVKQPRRRGYNLGWHDPRDPDEEPRRNPWFARLRLWTVS